MRLAHTLFLLPALALAACADSADDSPTNSDAGASAAGDAATAPAQLASSEAGASALDMPPSGSASRVVFEITDLDLGEMFQQEEHEIRFPFSVDGPDPVTITALDASCGCSRVGLEVEGEPYPINTPIKAGAEGAIVGTFSSAHYLNVKTSSIKVLGNARNLPYSLNLRAFIRRHFEVTPDTLRFGQVLARELQDQPQVQKVRVTSSEPFDVRGWQHLPPGVYARLTPETEMLDDGRQVRWLEVELTHGAPAGQLMSSLIADTTVGRELQVNLHAQVVGRVRYAPQQFLKFGVVPQGTKITRKIEIHGTDPELPLPTPKIEFLGPEHFETKLVEREPGSAWMVRVILKPETPIGRHGGRLVISYPDAEDLAPYEISVSALVRQ